MSLLLGGLGGLGEAGQRMAEINQKAWADQDTQREQSDLAEKKAMALEAFKQSQIVARQNAILNPGSPVAGPGSAGAATPTGVAQVQPGDISASDLPGLAKKYGIPESALRNDLAYNGGKGIGEMILKASQPDIQVTNGVAIDRKTQKPGFVPGVYTSADGRTVTVNVDESGKPVVEMPKGAGEAYGAYRGIEAGVKAATTPMKVYNPATQREEYTTEAEVVKGSGGAKIPGNVQAGRDAEILPILNQEMSTTQQALADAQSKGDTASAQRLQGDLSSLQREIDRAKQKSGASTGDRVAAGQSTTEKAAGEALGELNKNWVKTLDGVREANKAADDLLVAVGVTRDAMKNLGGTGWSTETKAQAANVLSGIGLGGDKAKLYASSAQQFQSAAMSRLWTTLNAAKGPQTEGDADRAKQTFAQLGNTTRANNFILDLAQAQAERDKIKANFYEQAVPMAREKGDLSEIDRAWQKRTPSVFKMPIMERWGVK